MSRQHDGLRILFHIGNPFWGRGHKGSSKLLALQSYFEQNLAGELRKLWPKEISHIFSLSWISHALKTLSEAHINIKTLTMELQFPVSDWEEKWIDTYLDGSVKLLDICNALSAELTQLDQGQLLLRYVLYILDISSSFPSSEQLRRAHVSLDDWLKRTNLRSPKLENCHAILQSLQGTLCLSKVKSSAKGRVLMRAFYGVEVMTLFICSVVIALLTGRSEPLMDLHVADKFLWSEAFNDLQAFLNQEIRRQLSNGKVRILKEMEELKVSALMFKSLSNVVDCKEESAQLSIGLNKEEPVTPKYTDPEHWQRLQECIRVLTDGRQMLGNELDSLSKQVNDIFQIVLTGREALLCNLRASNATKDSL